MGTREMNEEVDSTK